MWNRRNLCLHEKVMVIKSLMLSKLIYFLINIPKAPDNVLQNINRMLYGFLWGGKRDKVTTEIMMKSCRDGGIGMVDIFMLDKALKLTWMKQFLTDIDHNWKNVWRVGIDRQVLLNTRGYVDSRLIGKCKNPF